jgi:hypothetical protein
VARRRLVAAGRPTHDAEGGFDMIADLIGSIVGGPAGVRSRKKDHLKSTGSGKALPR